MENIDIRRLTESDYLIYRSIRLELLRNEPSSFGSSFREESLFPKDMWIERLRKQYVYSFGAFDKTNLIGIVILVLNPRKKISHVAEIHSMYIKPNYRQKGIAKSFLEYVFLVAKQNGVEMIKLEVVTTNMFAYKLYKSVGFESYGIEKKAMKIDHEYFDFNLLYKKLVS